MMHEGNFLVATNQITLYTCLHLLHFVHQKFQSTVIKTGGTEIKESHDRQMVGRLRP